MNEEEIVIDESETESDWENHEVPEFPEYQDPDIHLLGPVISTIREQCSTSDEWLAVLYEYPDIYEILLTWKRWVILTQTIGHRIQHFPFNSEKLEYLQSPFLDVLKELNDLPVEDALEIACRRGSLDVVEWVVKILKIEVQPLAPRLFIRASQGGNLELVKWIFACDPETLITERYLSWALQASCGTGALSIVQWLISIGPYSIIRGGQVPHPQFYWEEPFVRACQHGHLHVAKWLKENYPEINHRRFADVAFRQACLNDHLHVARWLKEMDPTIRPIQGRNNGWGDFMEQLNEANKTETIAWINSW